MFGIIFAALSALTSGFESVLHRYVLVKEDSISYAFVWHFLISLLFLPLFLIEFKLPLQASAWSLVIASSIFWASAALLGFKAYSHIEVSKKSPIGKVKILFAFLLAVIFLHESLTVAKALGIAAIFLGLVVLTYKKATGINELKSKGALLTIASAFLISCALLVDKFATAYFSTGTYAFLVYALPAVMFAPFALRRQTELKSIVNNKFSATLAAAVFAAASYYLILNAFKLAEASVVIPIAELSTLVTVAGGVLVLREKMEVRKIAAAVIVIVGALLVSRYKF